MLLPWLPLPAGVGQGRRHPSLIPSPCAGQSALYTSAGRQNRAKRKIQLPPKRVTDRQQALRTETKTRKTCPPSKYTSSEALRSARPKESRIWRESSPPNPHDYWLSFRLWARRPMRWRKCSTGSCATARTKQSSCSRRSNDTIGRSSAHCSPTLFRRGTHRKTRLGGSGTASQRNLPGGLRSLVRPDRKLRRTALDRHRLGIPRRTRHAEPVARHARAFRDRQPLPRGDHQRRPGRARALRRAGRRSPRTRAGRTGIHRRDAGRAARRRSAAKDRTTRPPWPAICSMPGA